MLGDNMIKIHEESFMPVVLSAGDSIVFTFKIDEKPVAKYTHECVENEVINHMVVFQIRKLFGLKTGYAFVVGEKE